MKKLLSLVLVLTAFHLGVQAQMPKPQRAEIKTPTAVCEECKNIIEAAIPKQVDGLIKINVNFKAKQTQVSWYPDRTNIEEIKTAIANAGFDADEITAEEDSYKKLPPACKRAAEGGGPQKGKPCHLQPFE